MFPRTSIVLCAVFFFAVILGDSFSEADESESKRDPKIAGIEDAGVEWGEKENFILVLNRFKICTKVISCWLNFN